MSSLTLPLPQRSLSLTAKKPFLAPAGFVFSIFIFAALFAFFAWWQAPGLVRDWQINQNPLVLRDGQVLDGECSSRRGLTDCEARLVYEFNGQSYDQEISIAFFDLSSGDYTVDLVISRDQPELATLSLGLEMLWNRTIVLAGFLLLFGALAIGMVVGGLRAWMANRAAATSGRMTLVPVEVIEVKNGARGPIVTYVDHPKGPRSRRQTRTQLAKGQVPLIGIDGSGREMGLAVVPESVGQPVLLDSELARIDLTETERQSALSAFDAQQQERGASLAQQAPAKKRPAGGGIVRGLMRAGGVLVLIALGVFGYWIYYATTAGDAFDSIGIEINNLMPEPLNNWACEQLYQRFGDERAPFGCVADDYTSWKVAPEGAGKSKIGN